MAKKKATGAKSPDSTAVAVNEEGALPLTHYRDEGNKLFGRKEYQKALETYEKGLKLDNSGAADRALVHSNRAACYMMLKRFKDAVNECSQALDAQPLFNKALLRRAKAYEQMGLYKQALSDIQKAIKAEPTPELQETEKRLKDVLAGKKVVAVNGAGKQRTAAKRSAQQQWLFQAKCTLDGETRILHVTSTVSYAELLEGVKAKFPGCGPVILKYLDKEGDLVTITDRNDVQKALAELVEHGERMQRSPGRVQPALFPPLRLMLTRAASAADVPPPPAAETQAMQQMLAARRLLAAQAEKAAAAQKAAEQAEQPAQQNEVYELDQWLIDFAQLFRDMLGIDPDRHLDLQAVGWDKCTEAMEAAVASEKAEPLFEAAAEKFQEVTATGLFQWGNTYVCVARKFLDEAATKGLPLADVAAKVEEKLAAGQRRYNEALGYKADLYDAAIGLGQLHFERAKLVSGLLVPSLKPATPVEGQTPEEVNTAHQAATSAAMKTALERLDKDAVAKGEEHFEKAVKMYAAAIEMLPEEERNKPIKQQPDKPQEGAAEEEVSFYAQTLVLWGNLLYEQSQIRAAMGGEWRPLLDEAVSKFTTAGCAKGDIRQALKNHTMKAEIDLGPEPEPEAPAAEKGEEKADANGPAAMEVDAAESGKADTEKVKGLPALGPKPKKKADA